MEALSIKPVSPYLTSPARTLYDACRQMDRDEDGKACATCPVRHHCIAELMKLGRRHDHPW
jgi:hypothetical protein